MLTPVANRVTPVQRTRTTEASTEFPFQHRAEGCSGEYVDTYYVTFDGE